MSSTSTTVPKRKRGGTLRLNMVLFYLFVTLFVLVSVAPLLWVFKMSIVTKTELFASPPTFLPQHTTGSHWHTIFANRDFLLALRNSVIIAGITTIICLFFGSIAAYAIARLRFRFKSTVLTFILAVAFFPQVAIIAPLFKQFSDIGLINTYWAAIIADTVFALPLTVWLLVAFFKELPKDLEEAARVDGATTLQAFRKVIVPLAAPGVFTAAILTFIQAWGDYLFALTFLFTSSTQPVTVVIPNFAGIHTIDYGAQAAAAVVVTVPLVILVLIFQRRIVSGLTAGAVKG
ncbi:carbohydrate ABC transporter permease [Rubrobacter calidifluminis]|uniref:carbohydrate ABC transporter permease n=1 Tax=Rubrobacter calidifluminis TaxID=1392640 RepID=UPI002361DB68|nr:carbohydrate ABC transporter permease [Rubrobacter calidifluminis]